MLAMRDMLFQIAQGPLLWVAFGIFVGGLVFQIQRFFALTRKQPRLRFRPGGRFDPQKGTIPEVTGVSGWRLAIGQTVFGTSPFTVINSLVFHLCFFAVALFDRPHTELLALSWGVRLPALAEGCTHWVVVLCFVSTAFYLGRRFFLARVRAITGLIDYAILLLVTTPMLSGYLAAHHYFDYTWMMLVHLLSSELLLILLPFTKLTHMVFFFLNRLFISHEYSFRRDGRSWPLNAPESR